MLDAVARILDREGLAGLNLSAIAEEAGINRATLHRRGASVTLLVIAVLRRASDELREALWPVVTGPGTAAERLHAALEELCAVAERHAGTLGALYRMPPRPLPDDPDRTTSFQFVEPFERLLVDGGVDGSLRSANPRDDALLVTNAVCYTYLHLRRAHGWGTEKATAGVVAMAMAAVEP